MLKDVIATDVNMIFNLNDFGEKHNINGKEIVCIVDYNAKDNSAKVDSFAEFGVNTAQITLFVKAEDFFKKINVGGWVLIDNIHYTVEHFSDNMGVYEIGLSINRN